MGGPTMAELAELFPDIATFQAFSQIIVCVIATWLYAHHLAERSRFGLRATAVIVISVAGTLIAIASGYTLYPTLTDNTSFVFALIMFALVIVALTVAVRFLWDASPWTALFCASSGYLVQSIVYGLDRVAHVTGIVKVEYTGGLNIADVLSYTICAVLVLVLFRHFITGRLQRNGLMGIRNPVMFFAVILAMVVALVLDLAIKDVISYDIPFRYMVVFSVLFVAICLFIVVAEFEILYNQRLQADVVTMERAMVEQKRQFELSRSTIEAINRRVHDIRHHVVRLLAEDGAGAPAKETLREIAREINVYDAAVKTGNAPLDVVLSEKGLLCQRDGITLSSVADGTALSFMAAADIYTLVGNALDGAIASVKRVADKSRRSISLNLRPQMGMTSLSIEHYYEGEPALVNGLPAGEGFGVDTML
ncbi:MAG: GHKL domain-containing protein, partial [Atopobiaceae bacterium]|nr:GHKL domain-containing protein [Atopobiaceae bacterium]